MTSDLYSLFRSRFPADRAKPFIETERGAVYSYSDLEDISGRFAGLLESVGVGKGDRVAVQVDKSPQAVFLYLACLRAGAVYVPLNTAYKEAEVEYFLSDAEPAAAVCRPETEPEFSALAGRRGVSRVLTLDQDGGGSLIRESGGLEPSFADVPADEDDLAAILYTSGTTGRAKGAMLSHGNLASNALTLHDSWGWTGEDKLLHALPIFHTHGLFVAIGCVLLGGGAMLFLPRFEVEAVLRLLPRATVFMGVPTFYTRLLDHPGLDADACRGMRLFVCGSAPLREDTFEAFRERTGHTLLERYGMTETGMNTSNPLHGKRQAGSIGLPLPGIEVRVTGDGGAMLPAGETGMLEVRGPNVFAGYWRMPGKTAEDFRDHGFFVTGDLATIDGEGYVRLVGRAKDLIISGGYNVYPKEVETAIARIDGVAFSAVVGLPHPDLGEAVVAVVEVRPRQSAPAEREIIDRLEDVLAGYKVPKRVFFVDRMPVNAMGKVQKKVLRERYGETFENPLRSPTVD